MAHHRNSHTTIIYSPRRRWRWWWLIWTPPALKMTTTTAQQAVIAQALKRCSSLTSTNRTTSTYQRGSRKLFTCDQEEFVLAMPQPVVEGTTHDPMVHLLTFSLHQRKWKFSTSPSHVCQSDLGEIQANQPVQIVRVFGSGVVWSGGLVRQGNQEMATNPGWISLTVTSLIPHLCNA